MTGLWSLLMRSVWCCDSPESTRKTSSKKYEIHNHVLEAVDSAKYLGIIFDSKLSFNHHIQEITKKANNTRQFLQRTLSRCYRATKEVCYKTHVRPTLEYASTVWDPHKGSKSQANLLESAQNKAARFVMSSRREFLQERRARARVVIFHKIQYSLVAIPMTLFQHTPSTITTRGACRTQAYKNTFIPTAPPPVPVFKSHCTCTIFIIFLPALLSPFCTSFVASRSCDIMPTAPCNYTYRYRYRMTVHRNNWYIL